MGGRYIITGVQLSLLTIHADNEKQKQCEILIKNVAQKQWIGQSSIDIKDDIELLKKIHDEGGITEVYVITGVEIGTIISDIQHDNFTKVMIDIHNIKQNRLIHKSNRPIDECVTYLLDNFSKLDHVQGNEIFTGIENEREPNE